MYKITLQSSLHALRMVADKSQMLRLFVVRVGLYPHTLLQSPVCQNFLSKAALICCNSHICSACLAAFLISCFVKGKTQLAASVCWGKTFLEVL